MKKLVRFNIMFGLLLFLMPACTRSVQPWYPKTVVDSEGHSTPALSSLMHELGLQYENNLASIVQVTQKAWLRPAGTERWQIVETIDEAMREKIKPLFIQLGLVEEIRLQNGAAEYDYGLLLGSRLKSTLKRIAFMVSLYEQGIRFKTLVALVGKRDIDAAKESVDVLLESPHVTIDNPEQLKIDWQSVKTETDMTRTVLKHIVLPRSMQKNISIEIIDAPSKILSDGKVARPTTADTVNKWLEAKPRPGRCIAFSSQPHVLYQQAVLATLLPIDYPVEVVGPQLKNVQGVGEILDALARLLFQEQKRRSMIR